MATILVTGAAGFIGSNLCTRLLAENYTVVGVDNFDPYYPAIRKLYHLRKPMEVGGPSFHFCCADAGNQRMLASLLAAHKPILVVHLAARPGVRASISAPAHTYGANTLCTQTVVEESCRCTSVQHTIIASSSSVYGNTIGHSTTGALVEHAFLHPISPYGASKLAAEIMAEECAVRYAKKVTALRFFTVYGPNNRPDMMAYKIAEQAFAENPAITFFQKDGMSVGRDWTYVDDITDGILKLIRTIEPDRDHFEVFNFGSGRVLQLSDFADSIMKELGRDPKELQKNIVELPSTDPRITLADIRKANTRLDYSPMQTDAARIARFCNWYKEYREIKKTL